MTTQVSQTDFTDRLLRINEGDALHGLRHARAKVVEASQSFHEFAFSEDGLELAQRQDRLLVATLLAQATGPSSLADEYRRQLLATEPREPYLAILDGAAQSGSADLDALASYARALAIRPATADQAALHSLIQAGRSVGNVVALAQIMGYVSYQSRMMIALEAMRNLDPANAADAARADDEAFVHPANLPAPGERYDIKGFTNASLGWKAWLPVQDTAGITEKQAAILDTSHPAARESDYYMLLIQAPELLEQRSLVYNAIMYAPGGAARAERELAAAAVSRVNGCVYCASVHAQRFEQLSKRNDAIVQIFEDPYTAGTTARERAIIQAAITLTENPAGFTSQTLQPMLQQGISPEQIRDLMASAAIFAWANRLMLNLGEHVWPTN